MSASPRLRGQEHLVGPSEYGVVSPQRALALSWLDCVFPRSSSTCLFLATPVSSVAIGGVRSVFDACARCGRALGHAQVRHGRCVQRPQGSHYQLLREYTWLHASGPHLLWQPIPLTLVVLCWVVSLREGDEGGERTETGTRGEGTETRTTVTMLMDALDMDTLDTLQMNSKLTGCSQKH